VFDEAAHAATQVLQGAPAPPDATTTNLHDSGLFDSLPPDLNQTGGFDASDFGGDSQPAPEDQQAEQQPTLAHIGRYALKRCLGRGGLGQVHEAWDPLLSRLVAVKTLHLDIEPATRDTLDGLFVNEARAAAGLNHPYIVTVHDAGRSPQGVYIAMERLNGQDLRQALAAGWAPTPLQAAQLVRRVADALAYAHGRGVVHNDVKPANIFITRSNKPKLLDFGIARVAHGAALPALDGLVVGTPHYLAPEQLLGGTPDKRTDIHALGVVLYELLAGRKAFIGETLKQVTLAVLHKAPPSAHSVRPEVPLALSNIAARAMARDPEQRYAGAAELASALRRWARSAANQSQSKTPVFGDREASLARPTAATARPIMGSLRLQRRANLLASAMAAAALVLAAGASVAWGLASAQPVPVRALSAPAFEAAQSAPAFEAAQSAPVQP
jgi:eukaryotic-like serine/threonine-protein kinase